MASRQYQTLDQTLEKMTAFFHKMRSEGNLNLPSERALCDAIGCSRTALRAALKVQEENGTVVKGRFGRTLSLDAVVRENYIGKFLFVTTGRDFISHWTWSKLWAHVNPLAEKKGIAADLLMFDYDQDLAAIDKSVFDGYDVIVLTSVPCQEIEDYIISLPGKIVIGTDEQHATKLDNIIGLDNVAVGKLAAKTLAEYGYKNPAFISKKNVSGQVYIPFVRYGEGFLQGCQELGLSYDAGSEYYIEAESELKYMKELLAKTEIVLNKHYDSVFFFSDTRIDLFYEAVTEYRKVPGDIGIITLNSYNMAISHTPPVTAVSHATRATAMRLVKEIRAILLTKKKGCGYIYLKPSLHIGETLNKQTTEGLNEAV